jgi:arginase
VLHTLSRRHIASGVQSKRGVHFASGAENTQWSAERTWYSKEKKYNFLKQKTLSVIGAPLAAGQHQKGVELGPQHIREGGLFEVARQLGWKTEDIGDLDLDAAAAQFEGSTSMPQVRNCEQIGLANRVIHNAVKKEAEKGNFVLTLGGDHSIGSASISGMKAVHDDLRVVWVDAHADSNTPATSPSGNYHGMSAAHILDWIRPELPGWEWLRTEHMVRECRLAFVGLRDVDMHERAMLRNSGVAVYTMNEVDRWGIGHVMEMAHHRVNPHADSPVHLTFDIDGCDPSVAPGTGTCSRGGLSLREAHYICEMLSRTNNLVSMDLVEVNPRLDQKVPPSMHGDNENITTEYETVRLAIELIGSALGRSIM